MSKVSIMLEFGSEQEAMAFLASRGGAAAPAPAPVMHAPVPQAPPPPAYAPQTPPAPPVAIYAPPPAMQPPPPPAGVAPQLPPGVQFLPTDPNGQPWTPTTVMPLMQQYGGSAHGVQGLGAVFKRYGFEPNITKLSAEQLAVVASHFKSMQAA